MIDLEPTEEELIASLRLTRDLKKSSTLLKEDQARYLVDLYYSLQKLRIRASAQVRAGGEEPNGLIAWTADMYAQLESDVKGALGLYAESQIPGKWALSILGIGPVLAAGLLAHIDIERAPTAGAVWRYAGYDPTSKWEKGQVRPWNARLKVVCWKIGQSFVKSANRPTSYYGPLYQQRKAWEAERNARKEYAEQAARILQEKKIGKETDAYGWYLQSMLPPAQIQARAERYAVKIFLSHYHAVAYESHFGRQAPTPYALAYLEHVHMLKIPNWL